MVNLLHLLRGPRFTRSLKIRYFPYFLSLFLVSLMVYFRQVSVFVQYERQVEAAATTNPLQAEQLYRIHEKEEKLTKWLNSSQDAWLKKREKLLSRDEERKLILYAYMRGGSSFLGSLFDADPDAFYVYEPLYATYLHVLWTETPRSLDISMHPDGSVKHIPDFEMKAIQYYITSMYNCSMSNMPLQFLTHFHHLHSQTTKQFHQCVKNNQNKKAGKTVYANGIPKHLQGTEIKSKDIIVTCQPPPDLLSMYRLELDKEKNYRLFDRYLQSIKKVTNYRNCMTKIGGIIKPCVGSLEEICTSKKLKVAKFIRLKPEILDEILSKHPDYSAIYYVRDPRFMVLSRQKIGFISTLTKSLVNEAKLLCTRMLHDYSEMQIMQRKYPGTILHFRYEDLMFHPNATLKKLFGHVGKSVPMTVYQKFAAVPSSLEMYQEHCGSNGNYECEYSLKSTFKLEMQEEIKKMDKVCANVYKIFGYRPLEVSSEK